MLKPQWVNGISYYCRLLYKTNQNLIKLSDLNANSQCEASEAEDLIYQICETINILIPFKICDNNNSISLENDARYYGILNFEKDLSFLHEELEMLINANKESLFNIKRIRNKREHEAFNILAKSFYSGKDLLIIVNFKYKDKMYRIDCEEIINIIKNLNIIFDKIINELKLFAKCYCENYHTNPYFNKYCNLEFERFNNIYNSNILKDCGRAMINF